MKIDIQGEAFEIVDEMLTLVPFAGIASGVIVGDGELVLTASHVLAQTSSLRISNYEGQSVTARPIAVDRETDVALLRLDEPLEGTQPVRFREAPPEVGMEVWVLGHPMGFDYSLSRGIVSALRSLEEMGAVGFRGHVIQLDAAVNQGASGGGFFDRDGRLLGIAGSIISRSGGFEGIGLGVALDAIQDVLNASPCIFLGIDAAPLPKALAEMLGLPFRGSFLVQHVFPGGLADKAGLRGGESPVLVEGGPLLFGGDVILEINGLAECREACRNMSTRSGQSSSRQHEISLTIWRGGERLQLTVLNHRAPHQGADKVLNLD